MNQKEKRISICTEINTVQETDTVINIVSFHILSHHIAAAGLLIFVQRINYAGSIRGFINDFFVYVLLCTLISVI